MWHNEGVIVTEGTVGELCRVQVESALGILRAQLPTGEHYTSLIKVRKLRKLVKAGGHTGPFLCLTKYGKVYPSWWVSQV